MNDYLTFEDRYSGPVEPDTLLPSQFFGALRQRAQLDGERRLMVAVLEDALHCFQKHLRARDPKARRLFLDAEEWITGTDRSWFFCFVNVCETLDLDPDYVREGMLKWKRRELSRSSMHHHIEGQICVDDDDRVEGADPEDVEQPVLREASGA